MNHSDKTAFVELLKRFRDDQVKKVPMDEDIFSLLLQCVAMPAVESVILRRIDDGSPTGRIDVFMTQRSAEDPLYARLWHSVGSFVRCREKFDDVIERINQQEINPARIVHRTSFAVQNNWQEQRGHGVQLICTCQIEGEPALGQWFQLFPKNQLPENIVAHHRQVLSVTLGMFLEDPYLRPIGRN